MFDSIEVIQREIDELKKEKKNNNTTHARNEEISLLITAKQEIKKKMEVREIWIIIVYTSFLAVFFSVIPIYAYNLTHDCFIRQLFYIGSSGGLGGVVYSILGFTNHFQKGDFNLRNRWWYFFRPITAVILGVFAFLFIAGGLMTLTDTTLSIPQGICYPAKGVMFYCAMAFLVGLSNNAFVKKLNDLAKTIFLNSVDAENEINLNVELKEKTELLDAVKKELDDNNRRLAEVQEAVRKIEPE